MSALLYGQLGFFVFFRTWNRSWANPKNTDPILTAKRRQLSRQRLEPLGGNVMRTIWFACALAFAAIFAGQPAAASEKLVISAWGGSWKEMVAKSAAAKFTAETGIEVEIVSGGTIDRLTESV